jgi:hypothetical protein
VIDYEVKGIGLCTIDYYDYDYDWNAPFWSRTFTHIPSRDFNGDKIVNLADLSRMAAVWMDVPSTGQENMDIQPDGEINCADLARFVEYWLEEL